MFDPITGLSNEIFMLQIATLFQSQHKLRRVLRKNGNSYFRLEITNKNILKQVIFYFDTYPLLGLKAVEYEDFRTAFRLYTNGTRLTEEKLASLSVFKLSVDA